MKKKSRGMTKNSKFFMNPTSNKNLIENIESGNSNNSEERKLAHANNEQSSVLTIDQSPAHIECEPRDNTKKYYNKSNNVLNSAEDEYIHRNNLIQKEDQQPLGDEVPEYEEDTASNPKETTNKLSFGTPDDDQYKNIHPMCGMFNPGMVPMYPYGMMPPPSFNGTIPGSSSNVPTVFPQGVPPGCMPPMMGMPYPPNMFPYPPQGFMPMMQHPEDDPDLQESPNENVDSSRSIKLERENKKLQRALNDATTKVMSLESIIQVNNEKNERVKELEEALHRKDMETKLSEKIMKSDIEALQNRIEVMIYCIQELGKKRQSDIIKKDEQTNKLVMELKKTIEEKDREINELNDELKKSKRAQDQVKTQAAEFS